MTWRKSSPSSRTLTYFELWELRTFFIVIGLPSVEITSSNKLHLSAGIPNFCWAFQQSPLLLRPHRVQATQSKISLRSESARTRNTQIICALPIRGTSHELIFWAHSWRDVFRLLTRLKSAVTAARRHPQSSEVAASEKTATLLCWGWHGCQGWSLGHGVHCTALLELNRERLCNTLMTPLIERQELEILLQRELRLHSGSRSRRRRSEAWLKSRSRESQ